MCDGRTDGQTNRRMDGRTDRPTDGWTNPPSYRDARTHLKKDAPHDSWDLTTFTFILLQKVATDNQQID